MALPPFPYPWYASGVTPSRFVAIIVPAMPSLSAGARSRTLLEAAVLPLILGSTVVLAKLALAHLGPLTLAASRYALAALILLPFAARQRDADQWSRGVWIRFTAMGISFYVIANGSLFLGLKLIPATTAALLLSLVPLLVLFMSVLWLREVPSFLQALAVVICIGGSVLFFSQGVKSGEPAGIVIVAIGLLGNAAFTIMGRDIARAGAIDTVSLTAVPLAIGAAILLPIALIVEGLPRFSPQGWSIVVVLALLNTLGAYLLYNHVLRVLTAIELTVLLNLTPLVTAGWAWLALGSRLSGRQLAGMLVVLVSVSMIQLQRPDER